MNWSTIWTFETARFRVEFQATPCEENPADYFQFADDIAMIESGESDWFDARVAVYLKSESHGDKLIGSNLLGGCSYASPEAMIDHRDANPMYRNCTIMREAKGQNVIICSYFPDMVRQAIADVRDTANMVGDLA